MAADEYLDRLPERFRAFKLGEGSARDLVRIVDRANGYAALVLDGNQAEPALELAVFRASDGSAVVGVTLRMAECDGMWYQTYFLTYDGKRWEDVTRASIPPEALRALRLTHAGLSERGVRFDLPRHGTTVVAQRIGDDGRAVETNRVLLQWAPELRRFRVISRR